MNFPLSLGRLISLRMFNSMTSKYKVFVKCTPNQYYQNINPIHGFYEVFGKCTCDLRYQNINLIHVNPLRCYHDVFTHNLQYICIVSITYRGKSQSGHFIYIDCLVFIKR